VQRVEAGQLHLPRQALVRLELDDLRDRGLPVRETPVDRVEDEDQRLPELDTASDHARQAKHESHSCQRATSSWTPHIRSTGMASVV
jgi:hypothetical protein